MRYTRTQQILRAQSAEAINNPEILVEFTAADLNARRADLDRAQACQEAGDDRGRKFWESCARKTERRIRRRADQIILGRRHALELEESSR